MHRKSFFIILITILCFTGIVYGERDMVSIYIDRGVQKYLSGDIDGAIGSLEDALSFDSKNEKAKTIIVKILVEKGSALYLRKEYPKAIKYLEKAFKIAPDNKQVKEMYSLAKEIISPPKPPSTSEVTSAGPPSEISHRASETPRETAVIARVQIAPSPDRELMGALLESFSKQQEKLIESFAAPSAALQELIIKSSEERKDLHEESKEERKSFLSIIGEREKALEKSFDRERETVGKSFMFGIIGIIAAVGIMIFFLYIVLHYISARREAALMQYQERMMRVIQEQNIAIAQKITSPMLVAPEEEVSAREMIGSLNPHIRARGVELLEIEFLKGGGTESAVKIFTSFLKDEDNRVRANAAKAIHRYEPETAISVLREMMNSPNKWMRRSALWVLGGISSSDAVEILLDCLNKEDIAISIGSQIRTTLIKILHLNKEIDPILREKIEAELLKKSKIIEEGVIVPEENEKKEE